MHLKANESLKLAVKQTYAVKGDFAATWNHRSSSENFEAIPCTNSVAHFWFEVSNDCNFQVRNQLCPTTSNEFRKPLSIFPQHQKSKSALPFHYLQKKVWKYYVKYRTLLSNITSNQHRLQTYHSYFFPCFETIDLSLIHFFFEISLGSACSSRIQLFFSSSPKWLKYFRLHLFFQSQVSLGPHQIEYPTMSFTFSEVFEKQRIWTIDNANASIKKRPQQQQTPIFL